MDGGTSNSGDDTIISGGGNDTIYGRSGNDLINIVAGVDAKNVHIQTGSGDDTIEVSLNELTHEDVIKGEKGSDTIAVVGNAHDHELSQPSFDSVTDVETLAFGSTTTAYTISGTASINLSSKVQAAGF